MGRQHCLVSWLAFGLAACGGERTNVGADSSSSETTLSDAPVDTTAPATAAARRDAPAPGPNLLTPDGWGPLRIGMSRAEVVAAAGEDANPHAVGGAEPEQCDEFRPHDAPAGLLVMIERGVLTRISVSRNSEIRTPEGFSVGDPAASVIAAYGSRAQVALHKYSAAPAKYITVWQFTSTRENRRGIRYEVATDDKVAHLRAGGPSIEYVEGCL